MSSLIPFSFESREIRFIPENDSFSVVAKDVADALGYGRFDSNLLLSVPEEWKGTKPIRTPGGIQEMLTLSEPGLYFFIGRSDKPKALPFQKWVYGEVIPSIRKTGAYALPDAQPQPAIDPIAAQLSAFLKGKVIVDYEALCRLARMTRAGLEKIAEGEKLLEEAEQVGLDLERQCGKPLIKFDIPADRLERHRATLLESRSKRPTSPPDLWESQVRAFVADLQEVTTTLVLDSLGVPPAEQTQVPKNRVARILRNMGFIGYVVNRGGRTHRIWQRHH